MRGQKVLITGVTGKIIFPIARTLAPHNEVRGVARLADPAARDRLITAGVRPVALDVSCGDFASLPDDFTYVFHAVVADGTGDWPYTLQTNAHASAGCSSTAAARTASCTARGGFRRMIETAVFAVARRGGGN